MLPWLLFFMYTFLLLAALYRLAATRKIAIRPPVLAAAFLLKVGLGCLYGFIFLKYYGGDDTWNYHRESILEQGKLLHHTGEFFRDLLPGRPFGASHSWLEGIHYYLMDLEYWAIVKTLALFNFLSGGNYYINVLFFDALVFAGPLLLFKLCSGLFPQREKLLCIGLFFIPSVTFWLSGIRSEGLLLLSMAVVFYYYYQWTRRRTLRSALLCTAGLLGILVFRSEFLFTFIPAFLGLVLAKRKPSK